MSEALDRYRELTARLVDVLAHQTSREILDRLKERQENAPGVD